MVWVGLAFLTLIGSGRSPQGIHDLIDSLDSGQPGWLAAIDRHAESLVAHRGLAVAVVFAVICVVVAGGVFLPARPGSGDARGGRPHRRSSSGSSVRTSA